MPCLFAKSKNDYANLSRDVAYPFLYFNHDMRKAMFLNDVYTTTFVEAEDFYAVSTSNDIKSNDVGGVTRQVIDRINSYLEFRIDTLLDGTDAYVFGGAVRDSIAKDDIHDVDIVCFKESFERIEEKLDKHDYKPCSGRNEFYEIMYKSLGLIFEPYWYVRKIDGMDRIINIIRPSDHRVCEMLGVPKENWRTFDRGALLEKFIANVDLNCCGVSLSHKKGFQEHTRGAYNFCFHKVFEVDRSAFMYNPCRINQRVEKMENRGWIKLL